MLKHPGLDSLYAGVERNFERYKVVRDLVDEWVELSLNYPLALLSELDQRRLNQRRFNVKIGLRSARSCWATRTRRTAA